MFIVQRKKRRDIQALWTVTDAVAAGGAGQRDFSHHAAGDIQQAEKLLFVQWFVVFEGVNVLLKLFKI